MVALVIDTNKFISDRYYQVKMGPTLNQGRVAVSLKLGETLRYRNITCTEIFWLKFCHQALSQGSVYHVVLPVKFCLDIKGQKPHLCLQGFGELAEVRFVNAVMIGTIRTDHIVPSNGAHLQRMCCMAGHFL